MKKTLVILPILMLSLVACNSENKISDTPKQIVSLNADNFSTYVATNSSATAVSDTSSSILYYSYFIGADYCKFINCTVTYTYVGQKYGSVSEETTINLSLSGDGETEPYFVYGQNRHEYYYISICSASGTVAVYR